MSEQSAENDVTHIRRTKPPETVEFDGWHCDNCGSDGHDALGCDAAPVHISASPGYRMGYEAAESAPAATTAAVRDLYLRWFGAGWPDPEDIPALHADLRDLAFPACGDSPGHGMEGRPPFRCELPLGHGGCHAGGRGTWS